ncbi:HDOD domain-containing protein [Pseudomonas sp. LPB0260]|uniref:HDOD domain-containing protein n=1 Tax=Pseudomonas sp. LPB0260 TaxID=2614442 RepID=UPI0015C20F1A|nr:HDOD domain-containing protein [Pseudomonas sp. LPB0260]QLC73561.1 HDOD domain-containing protein [Pseudomonas sp. LPB0260]QLC76335.1 HDOD domain-containing protein [Pseudomonas sp. LPB0260]
MPTPLPRSLDAWLKQLDKQPIPVPADSHQRVCRALADSRCSLRDIAELMQASPALSLRVLREANRHSGGLGEPAESLESAIGRLGLQRTEELVQRQPTLPAEEVPPALRQIQLVSQHASQQANGLFAGRLARLWQEIHWGSLLFLAPIWTLLAARPELFETWEQRVLVKGEPASRVEQELLGVPLLELCLALAERWRLPEWIVQGYRLLTQDRRLLIKALHIARDNEHPLHQQQMLDADPQLRRWLTQPANTIVLANGLALSAHQAWSSPHSLRWQRLSGLYLQLPLVEVQQQIHQQAAQSARLHAASGLWHPAEALLWPPTARHLRSAVPEAPAPAPAKATAVDEWRRLCTQLLAQPSAFNNLEQLASGASQALQACGLARVLLLLADRSHSRLRALQHAGLEQPGSGLALDPQHSQVLRRLLKEPGQLRLSPSNIAQFSALLPGALKALFPSEHLLLRSLACNGRVALLLVVDRNGGAFSDTQLQAFGKTAQCIERALNSFARRAP